MLSFSSKHIRIVFEAFLVLLVTFLLATFAVRSWREREHYTEYTDLITTAGEQIRVGMSLDQVLSIVKAPPDDIWIYRIDQKSFLVFHWDASRHRACFFESGIHEPAKGHEQLTVSFDENETVERIYAGVN